MVKSYLHLRPPGLETRFSGGSGRTGQPGSSQTKNNRAMEMQLLLEQWRRGERGRGAPLDFPAPLPSRWRNGGVPRPPSSPEQPSSPLAPPRSRFKGQPPPCFGFLPSPSSPLPIPVTATSQFRGLRVEFQIGKPMGRITEEDHRGIHSRGMCGRLELVAFSDGSFA